jgi:DNA-binding transcriptional MocR family regulator
MRKALHVQCLKYIQAIIEYFPADTRVSRPHGGFVLWMELNKKVNAFQLRTDAMKHRIAVVPGKLFSGSGQYTNFIRLSYGRPWDDEVDWGLMMLGKMVKKF